MFVRNTDPQVAITMVLTSQNQTKNKTPALATLQATFKVAQLVGEKEKANTDPTLSPFLKVEHEGITPNDEITLCYTAAVNGQSETIMNHFPLAKKSTKTIETTLKDSSGTYVWLTITCTPPKQ
jgi:hypothetical protein